METEYDFCMYNVQGEVVCTKIKQKKNHVIEPFDSTASQNKRQSLPDILNTVIGNSNVCNITLNTVSGQVDKVSILPCSR